MVNTKSLKIILVSTSVGYIGSGKGGGVELTICSLIKGLISLGHDLVLVAPEGSKLPMNCSKASLKLVSGVEQPSWQHQGITSPVIIPDKGVLPLLWNEALELAKSADLVLNFGYDWLPIWLTSKVNARLFHLISMGGVSNSMKSIINELSLTHPSRFAFHTKVQSEDYELKGDAIIVGNGFDLSNYFFKQISEGYLGWAGRIAPEKGLDDAVKVASSLGERLFVWGVKEDIEYAKYVECLYPNIIDWRGYLPTDQFQRELGGCRALINTPKWNEAYGNVVVEALACGVPVVAYERGGPGELILSGKTGWLVPPDDVLAMTNAVKRIDQISRKECRDWVELEASQDAFARRIEEWIFRGLNLDIHSSFID